MMIKRICCFLLAFLFFGSFSIKASKKGDVVIMKRIDSLKLSLSRSASLVERLHVLYDLSACYRDEQEECDYCMMLYSEASKVDSIFLKEYAAVTLTRYYYNKNLMDSVVYWSGQVKRIAQERGSYSDRYFLSAIWLVSSFCGMMSMRKVLMRLSGFTIWHRKRKTRREYILAVKLWELLMLSWGKTV